MSQKNTDSIPHVIQDAVEICANQIVKALGTACPNFIAVHFICGKQPNSEDEPAKPGLIRKSEIRLSDQFLARISVTTPNTDSHKHGEVLLNHVRLFDRKNTLLTSAMSRLQADKKGLWLRIGEAQTAPMPEDWTSDSLMWPDRIDEYLVPKAEAIEYLKQAYATGRTPEKHDEIFAKQRAETYGRWITANEEQKDQAWKNLHPLQSSLVYFAVACDKKITGDLLVFRLKELDRSGITPVVVVVASGHSGSLDFKKIEDAIAQAEFDGDIIRDYLRKDRTPDHLGEAKEQIYASGEIECEVKRSAESIFPVPGHETRFELLFRWMALLIQRLREKKHEGHSLDFWFVAGDASEFEDDHDIRMRKQFRSLREASILSPPQDSTKLETHLDKLCKLLEKEHFPWFSGGQNALFFDLSHKDMLARGLCGIKRSSWEFQLGDLYKSKQEQEDSPIFPACLIGFVSARHGGAGIAVCDPQANSEKKLRLLARLGKEGWQSGQDNRVDKLKTIFTQAYNAKNGIANDSVETFARLCQLIADNPHAGGTLVLLNGDKRAELVRMGDPWNFGELTLSEQIPLVSHDGATLILIENGKPLYHHRYMLTPEQLPSSILKKLAQIASNHESFLSSVGTRRWSSAMAAFRKGVEAVIVISQDGDITCFRSPGVNQWNHTTVQIMTAGQIPGNPTAINNLLSK